MTNRLNLGAARGWARAARERTVEDLARFVRHPSVSGDRQAAQRCAAWLATHLRSLGLRSAEVVATRGNPAVIAEWRGAPGRATLLVYGHYDVQPRIRSLAGRRRRTLAWCATAPLSDAAHATTRAS